MKSFIINCKKKNFLNILGICFIILIWFTLSHIYNNSLIVPKISEVFLSLFKLLKESRTYILIFKLFVNIILTIAASFSIAVILAILSFKFEKFYHFISPLITMLKSLPIVAIIILLIISVMNFAPYVATSFVIIPIIFEGVYSTLKQIDSSITDDIKTLSDINMNIIFKFYLPLIFPNILTSLLQSFGLGLKVMVMTEYTSPKNNTFGAEIKRYYDNNDMAKVYAIVLIVIVLSFIVDKILKVTREKANNN